MDDLVVACIGMGVDSIGILTRWIHEPHTRDFDLDNLICLTAMTGDEYASTRRLMDTGKPGYQNLRDAECDAVTDGPARR